MTKYKAWDKFGKRLRPGGKVRFNGKLVPWLRKRQKARRGGLRLKKIETPAQRLIAAARHELGVHEVTPNWGPRVREYIIAGGGTGPESWCGDFLEFCLMKAGIANVPVRYVPGGEAWARSNKTWRTKAAVGRLGLCEFTGDQTADHVGVVVAVEELGVWMIEGNTSSTAAGSQDNGDVVALKFRPHSVMRGYIDVDGGA